MELNRKNLEIDLMPLKHQIQPNKLDTEWDLFSSVKFDGAVYEPEFDDERLHGQLKRVYNLMKDGLWRTLQEIATTTGDPESSISAQLRHLRKPRFGNHKVNKKPRGNRKNGLWEYKLGELTEAEKKEIENKENKGGKN